MGRGAGLGAAGAAWTVMVLQRFFTKQPLSYSALLTFFGQATRSLGKPSAPSPRQIPTCDRLHLASQESTTDSGCSKAARRSVALIFLPRPWVSCLGVPRSPGRDSRDLMAWEKYASAVSPVQLPCLGHSWLARKKVSVR